MGPPLQSQSESESFGFGRGPPLQGDFVRRVVPRPAPTRGRGTSGLHTNAIRSDEIPLHRRPSRPWRAPLRRATSLAQCRSPAISANALWTTSTKPRTCRGRKTRWCGDRVQAGHGWPALACWSQGWRNQAMRTIPAPPRLPPEGDKSRRFGSGQKPASPQRRTKPVDSGAFQPGRILNQSPEKNLIPGLPGGPGTAGSTPRPCVVPPSGPG